jgi:hypothetical protein
MLPFYTPHIHTIQKHPFKKHLIRNIVLSKGVESQFRRRLCPIVMERGLAKQKN